MKKKIGIIDKRLQQYTLEERLHLIRCIANWGGNLYIYGELEWENSIRLMSKQSEESIRIISRACIENNIKCWVWMKPGDYRYVMHKKDREVFIENVCKYLSLGVDGFYLLMDDMHPSKDNVRIKDAKFHSLLIKELQDTIGDKFKAICGQHYHGRSFNVHKEYWDLLFENLNKEILITWTGPMIWNAQLSPHDFTFTNRHLMLFENFFASDSEDSIRAPIYPYKGRSKNLLEAFEVIVLNPNNHYAWNLNAIYTFFKFCKDPLNYVPDDAFKESIREINDMYISGS